MTTLIIGKNSNLSQALAKKIDDCVLVSSRELTQNINLLSDFKDKKIKIIFNNFQTALQLNNASGLDSYIENSIGITSKILEYFKETDIEKIIYTSSSSVYGNNIFCNEHDEVKPLSLHAALKVSNEKLIEKFCTNYHVDYTIARIFNVYGANDTFSIISKIITAYKENKILSIVNNGNAIRDFIHIDDVVEAYIQLLTKQGMPIVNIGTGNGNSIKSILTFLKNNHIELKVQNIQREELKISTADNSLLLKELKMGTFKDVESYLEGLLKKNNI